MARVNAEEWLEKWGQRLNASGQYIQNGVKSVKESPGKKAAEAQARMLANLIEAIQSGHWARQVSAVSKEQWQEAMIKKGIPRISQGVQSAQASKTEVIKALLKAVDNAASEAHALPKGGIEESIARAAAFMRSMQENAPKKQGIK